MIDSHLDSERLLAVAHGQARCSPEEAAHLERCAECRLEWNLVRTARTMGRAPAERIPTAQTAATVARRLEAAPAILPGVRSSRARWVLGLAAAAAITVAVLFSRGKTPHGAVPSDGGIAVLHELDGLTAAELEVVLETIPPAANEAVHVESAAIDDLSASDLERMLHSME